MIASTLKNFTRFYQVGFVLLMIVTLGSIFYFWKQGFIDGSRGQDLHQASFLLESFTEKKQFDEVQELIDQENPKSAIQKIKSFENELETIDRQVSVTEFDNLEEEIQELKSASAKLIAFSRSSQVVSVFSKKLDSFNSYVKQNNWRTLTRLSERVALIVSGHLNKNKLETLATSVIRDFDSMAKITENSVLSRKDKSEIISRISNLKVEMEMLKEYSNQKDIFNKQFDQTQLALNNWISKVSPAITLSKLEIQEVGRYYVMAMMGILLLMSTMFFSSFFFNSWFTRRESRRFENAIEDMVTEGFVGGDRTQFSEQSQTFQKYAYRMMSYIDKRMSFGSIFQDSLPLSSILLDQNLKVVWANQQFCNGWEISEDEIKKDYMSWDYLNKLTNIGTDDPVLEALKNNVAGIYQIQIKPHDEAEVRPFEMFVSPVKYKNEKRVMLFFYDLTNLEATISEQAKSILNPVKESLSMLRRGKFAHSEQLEYEFKIADINDVYENFLQLNEQFENKDLEANEEIHNLIEQINTYDHNLSEVMLKNDQNISTSRDSVDALKVFKKNVIALSELTQKLDRSSAKGRDVIHTNIATIKSSIAKIDNTKNIVTEIIEGLPKFDEIKDQIKHEKVVIQEVRSRLGHEMSQLEIMMRRTNSIDGIEKLSRILDKIKVTYNEFANHSEGLDKKLAMLDISMSKTQMVVSAGEQKIGQVNSGFERQQLGFSEQEVQVLNKLTEDSASSHEQYEEEIISALQLIFKGTKTNLNLFSEIRSIDTANVKDYPQIDAS